MASDELRFKHIGLSSDGAVIFCEMDNGKTYAMPLCALETAEDWDPKAKPKAVSIIHDGYAAFVKFDNRVKIDFPADFVLHICEPTYTWYKNKGRAVSGVGRRIREVREARRLTLNALAAKCGIAKPNLSRLEHDLVRPKFETVQAVAAGLGVHPAMLIEEHAWTQTRFEFAQWKLSLLHKGSAPGAHPTAVEVVRVFLATRPEHRYARMKLLKYADLALDLSRAFTFWLDADKWAQALAETRKAGGRAENGKG